MAPHSAPDTPKKSKSGYSEKCTETSVFRLIVRLSVHHLSVSSKSLTERQTDNAIRDCTGACAFVTFFIPFQSIAGAIFLDNDVTRASGSLYGRVNKSVELASSVGCDLQTSTPSAEVGLRYTVEKGFTVSSKITHDIKVPFDFTARIPLLAMVSANLQLGLDSLGNVYLHCFGFPFLDIPVGLQQPPERCRNEN